MVLITQRKKVYPVSQTLLRYLERYDRAGPIPVRYDDLVGYTETVPVYDKHGRDTLWQSILYPDSDRKAIARELVQTYAALRVMGESSFMEHLVTDRIDVATYGNTQPFRIRILNTVNENFDYFYVKRADASRVYGLELEHLLSPNRMAFLVQDQTLVEEHISGIPGDVFFRDHLRDDRLDEVRLAKEFVKFNERCFLRLLGDMHSGNFVVVVTQDFDETAYRIRAIDFDQQSYEPRASVYLPQYYKQNNPLILLGMKCMTPETVAQYQEEERTLMRMRARTDHDRLETLLHAMESDTLAPREHVHQLRQELATRHADESFLACESMGCLVRASLARVGIRT